MLKLQKMRSSKIDQVLLLVTNSLLLILNAFSQSNYVRSDKVISDKKG
jgi:hypothetical protein